MKSFFCGKTKPPLTFYREGIKLRVRFGFDVSEVKDDDIPEGFTRYTDCCEAKKEITVCRECFLAKVDGIKKRVFECLTKGKRK